MEKNRKKAFLNFAKKVLPNGENSLSMRETSIRQAQRGFVNRHFGSSPYAKSAFTFAELMISLVIIAVITALLYPTIREISPNNNKQLYRSAYKTVELTVEDIISAQEDISSSLNLCNAFKDRLNAVGNNNCDAAGAAITLNTSNGMRWWFQNYDNTNGTHTIYVDVNPSNNSYPAQTCAASDCPDDPSNFPTSWQNDDGDEVGYFRVQNPKVRDTFEIQITSDGKVVPDVYEIALQHLNDTSE